MAPRLDSLPTEILILTALHFGDVLDRRATQYTLASLALTNRRLHDVFNPMLWKYNGIHGTQEESDNSVLLAPCWAAARNRVDIFEIAAKFRHNLGSFLRNDPIQVAARNGHDDAVSWLIDHKVPLECILCERIDVDSPFPVRPWPENHVSPVYSALHTAIKAGQESTSMLLLARGAKYRFRNSNNMKFSALHAAALHGLPVLVRYLIKTLGIDVNEPDQSGLLPLHYAVSRRHNQETLQVFIDLGADIHTEVHHRTPLSKAVTEGYNSNAITLLKAGARVNPIRDDVESPLIMFAGESYHLMHAPESILLSSVLGHIIHRGAILDKPYRGDTALCSAVEKGSASAIYELLKAGANVHAPRPRDGKTPFDLLWTADRILAGLHNHDNTDYDAMEEFTDKAKLLMAGEARIDDTMFQNSSADAYSIRTQLRTAVDICLRGVSRPLYELLRHAGRRNLRDGYIDKLFETCLEEEWAVPAKILRTHGADSELKNQLALAWAGQILERDEEGSETEAFSFCLEFLHKKQIESLFLMGLQRPLDRNDKCGRLVDHGALSSWKKTGEFKPWLHLAASRGDLPLVRRLVIYGMDVNALDQNFATPLVAALQNLQREVVDFLYEFGADPFQPRQDAECRQVRRDSPTQIMSAFELAIRQDYLPHIRKWWLKTPPESRRTEDVYIPRVLYHGHWYQHYLHDDPDDDLWWGYMEWLPFNPMRLNMRRLDENEEKKTNLALVMETVDERLW
ncbi:ankyrin [Rostrohypoxylon terebratum]|nr:ankyrin [Rostrohypoxylon terebratum]